METKTFKNVIIGFGKAGRALAKSLSQHGEDVVIIEREQAMYGGTCPNVGCAPSKTLIVAGHKNMGFKEAMTTKYKVREMLHNGAYHGAADEPLVSVIDGIARFINQHTIEVDNHGEISRVTGERIFINTGATPVIPEIAGIHEAKNVVTSEGAMDLDSLPEHLVIIGAGYIGLEFAGMFNKFGSKVTILEPHETFLPKEDRDVAEIILNDLKESGVEVHLGVAIDKITDDSVVAGGKSYPANKVLVATGRRPNISELRLENAGVALWDNGYIKVDDTLKTSSDNIWALGDVRGGGQFYYLSTDDFRIVNNQLFGDGSRLLSDRTIVPYSVFITPTLSHVGLDEQEAQRLGVNYRLFKMAAAPIVKTKVVQEMRGLLKALVDPETEEILGVTLYHEDSHEVINLVSLAMKMHTPYTVLRDQIFTHPTMGEGLNDLFQNEVK
ncbi:FAD-dependent oxidoreductase [Lactococcus allomyrinae]|uniref:Pyridine nucleotide-disulfide oxidoreductase n=1 Tax=Lactococcus allomyrinae TaxID=2419773 RepID=A0A387BI82_9LACT|nr:FAD-dependent oxidoreductase [Lactococcus allomyrinae]AYG01079.1 pyridine nucleotide-disulfide oxidoreductase [Lactococcus allomyrinae]